MSRTNKGTRAKGLPPKIQLVIQDSATGSFPTVHRTPSDNRTGNYRTFFDDTKTMTFGSEIKKTEGFNATKDYTDIGYSVGTDLKVWWNMEITNSNGTLKDESVIGAVLNRHPLTLFSGAMTSSDVPSQYAAGDIYRNDHSLVFQSTYFQYASDDSSTYQSETDRASAKGWSMACHVKFIGLAYAYNPIMWRGEYTGSLTDYGVMVDSSGYLYAGVGNGLGTKHRVYRTSSPVINVGNWQHVAVIFNGTGFDFYVDGINVSGGSYSDTGWGGMNSANHPMFLALMRDIDFAGGEFLSDVFIDNFTWFDNTISAEMVSVLMIGGPVNVTIGGVVMPSGVPSGSTVLSNSLGQLDTELNSDIITTGIVRKGVGDAFIKFTPGQLLEPFRDHSNPAVDALSLTSSANSKTFYATGSAASVVGEGFGQPLWSKTKFEIDLTPAYEHSFYMQNNLSTSLNFPMAYWNKDTKIYEGIGLGYEFGLYTGSTESSLQRMLDDQCLGFVGGTDNGGGNTNRDRAVGAVMSNFGFPYHPKFQARTGSLINMSDYIDEPFLLEKIVLEFSGAFAYNNTTHGTASRLSLCTFFILNQRKPFGISEPNVQQIKWKDTNGGTLQRLTTGSFLPTTYNGTYVDTIRDIVTWGQVLGNQTASETLLKNKEIIVSGREWSDHVVMSASMKNPLPSDGLLELWWTTDGAAQMQFVLKNENSSRNGLFVPTGRDWLGALEKGQITTVDELYGDLPLVLLDRYFKVNPYILLPSDQLVFGWQLPFSFYINSNGFQEQYQGVGPQLTFAATPSKITFYGSKIKNGTESHDTLNQLLTSQGIHEVIG